MSAPGSFQRPSLLSVVVSATCAGVAVAALASSTPTPRPIAKVCHLMPVADVEHALGAKITSIGGSDHQVISTCSARFGADTIVKVQYAKPGTEGLPHDVNTMLAVPRQIKGESQDIVISEFDGVGCYGQHLKAKGTWAAFCGNPHGYVTLTVTRPPPMTPLDTVRKLLAAAQAKI